MHLQRQLIGRRRPGLRHQLQRTASTLRANRSIVQALRLVALRRARQIARQVILLAVRPGLLLARATTSRSSAKPVHSQALVQAPRVQAQALRHANRSSLHMPPPPGSQASKKRGSRRRRLKVRQVRRKSNGARGRTTLKVFLTARLLLLHGLPSRKTQPQKRALLHRAIRVRV